VSGFKFSDLIPPGEGARLALQRELEARRERWNRPGYHYRGGGDFLLQHGQFYPGRVIPDQYADLQGEPTYCFGNAAQAALARPDLQFCEGVYALNGHFTPHAWCIDGDGGVVEVTFPTTQWAEARDAKTYMKFNPPERWGYWGVVFPELEFIIWHGETLGMPMLDRPGGDQEFSSLIDVDEEHDYPLLKVPFDPARKSL
jgi:hypothetical protein